MYGARAAIINGLLKKNDLKGAILYTTLNPGNVCAQIIRDVEIKEVVFISNKFHDKNFMEASERILRGISCRYSLQEVFKLCPIFMQKLDIFYSKFQLTQITKLVTGPKHVTILQIRTFILMWLELAAQ